MREPRQLTQAAVWLQAVARGKSARQSTEVLRDIWKDAEARVIAREQKAATMLQALMRGKVARRSVDTDFSLKI